MSAAVNTSEQKAPGLSDRKVRREARRIADRLDSYTDNLYGILGCIALLGGIASFPYCWKILNHEWWQAGLWAIGVLVLSFIVAVAISLFMERGAWLKAARRFDLRFPEDSPNRLIAESMLMDMEPSSDAVKSFLEHVVTQPLPATGPTVDINRRVSRVPDEAEIPRPVLSDPRPP